MFSRTFVAVAFTAAAFATPAAAMDFARHPLPEIGPDAVALSLSGEISPGDGERFRQFVNGLPSTDRIVLFGLNSVGGSINEALYIARMIHQSGAVTMVFDRSACASACFLMFAAGERRSAAASARIGVHSSSVNGIEDQGTLADTTELARLVKAAGIPDAVIGKMVATPPGQISWLDTADLAAMNVRIIAVQPSVAAPPPVASFPPSATAPGASAYTAGLADRTRLEDWLRILDGSFHSGAAYWLSVRSTAARSGACHPGGQPSADDFTKGCLAAKQLTDPMDYRRTHETEYKAGWNNYSGPGS